ncbi:MAG: hypothetical protein Q7T50_03335 [Candidatus Magasanikbacteria bacterium]|nr:hypothetical protein [Candidatus Magasanikbacteria bacterium]
MATNDGSINFFITPKSGHGDNLFRELKKTYSRYHLYYDGYFIYLKSNTDCSYGLLKTLQSNILIKTVSQNLETKPKMENTKMETNAIERENFEKNISQKLDNLSIVKAKIKVRPTRGTNRTILFEDLSHAFPGTLIIMVDEYIVLIKETEEVSNLITQVQAIHGVEYALYA